jgi:tRNA (guanine-N7-)-methyltransferase
MRYFVDRGAGACHVGAMSESDQTNHRQTSFFGRRKGHKLRPHQAELVDQLLPKLAIDIAGPPPERLDALFAARTDGVRLEIGFGGGEYLLAESRAHPDTGFIGCEPYLNGLAKILARLEAEPAVNLRLFTGDAAELLAWLPDASLRRIDLIHPDPWPKRRHWKRRFVQQATIAAAARVLKAGGEFRFVSDIDDYAAWTLELFGRSVEFAWTAERADDWRKPWADFTHTRYGAKAVREGRAATYLIFRKR